MNNWKNKILHIFLFIFVITMVVLVFNANTTVNDNIYHRNFNEGWTIKLNSGATYSDANLDDQHIPVTNMGDQVVMYNTLPEDLEPNRTMMLSTVHSVVDVYIGDEKIYTHGREEFKEGRMIGFGVDFISIPVDSAGKPIKIYLFVTENNAFSTMAAPIFYDEATVYKDYLSEKMVPLVVSISLIVIGVCISLATFFSIFKSHALDRLFCIGIFSLCIGCWSLCNYNLGFLLTDNMAAKSTLEYMSLYIVTLPILFYFRKDIEEHNRKWEIFVYYALTLVVMQLFLIAVVLQVLNIVHFPAYVKMFQMCMAATGLFVAYLLIRDMFDSRTHKILVWGFMGILVIAIRDLIVFNVIKYMDTNQVESEYKSYIAGAALLFVVTLFLDFVMEMRKQLYSNAQSDFYIKLAYYDVLTDLFTRRKAEEIFETLDNTPEISYTLVQYDLNNLKVTNDVFGHEEGDILILRFTNVLRETFNEGEILARMGGDEFIAIVNGNDEDKIKAKLKLMDEKIDEANVEGCKVKLSVSYGYATSSEFEKPVATKVYKLADQRMYKQKEEYYRTHGMNRRRSDNV